MTPVAWMRLTFHSNGVVSHSLQFSEHDNEELKEGDSCVNYPLVHIPAEPQWIADLREELMVRTKITHNFTFSRDEVMQMLRITP